MPPFLSDWLQGEWLLLVPPDEMTAPKSPVAALLDAAAAALLELSLFGIALMAAVATRPLLSAQLADFSLTAPGLVVGVGLLGLLFLQEVSLAFFVVYVSALTITVALAVVQVATSVRIHRRAQRFRAF
ncbi:hypothetical protein DIPPA_31940 [Diplonema papillatum]|nr:hypothetical protein DIPPA_31940 [Diplonema papillatum]